VATGTECDLLATVDLVTRVQQGDRAAVERLFRRYRPRLESFLFARVPPRARRLCDTQDLVQEVCLKILAALDRFHARGIGSFWWFARSIARNLLIDIGRRSDAAPETSMRDGSSSCPSAPGPSPSKEAERNESAAAFDRALEHLPEKQRTALLMRLELGLEWNLIAADCDFPSADAARVAVKRGLQEMAREMAGHGDAA
jgi:RNA polymerase sigma-70 factor (ECF subfamily)